VHNNETIFTNITITLEDGKLKTCADIVISIMILIVCRLLKWCNFM
jgi:hypothetical protein